MYVNNFEYRRVREQDEEAKRRRKQADRNRLRAEERLRLANETAQNQRRTDSFEINDTVRREEIKLAGGIDSLRREILGELESRNMQNSAEIARLRRELINDAAARAAGLEREVHRLDAKADQIDRKARQIDRKADRVSRQAQQLNERTEQLDERITQFARESGERFRQMADRLQNQEERARLYYSQLDGLLKQIGELHPDKLLPEETDELRQSLSYVEIDLENGDYEAAIGVAQSHIPAASELQMRLELLNDRFSLLVIRFQELALQLFERLEVLYVPEQNQAELTEVKAVFDGRIDFWSEGLLQEITKEFDDLYRDAVDDYMINMKIEALEEAVLRLDPLNARLDDCIKTAQEEFQEKVRLAELAERIYQLMTQDMVWELTNSGFEQEDERRSYQEIYEDGAGNIASFVIVPGRKLLGRSRDKRVWGKTQFRLNVSDGKEIQDASCCDIVRNGIINMLSEQGIEEGIWMGKEEYSAKKHPNQDMDAFCQEVMKEGNQIKKDRLNMARETVI